MRGRSKKERQSGGKNRILWRKRDSKRKVRIKLILGRKEYEERKGRKVVEKEMLLMEREKGRKGN